MNERERARTLLDQQCCPEDIAWLITDGGITHVDHLIARTGMTRANLEATLRRNGYTPLVGAVSGLTKLENRKSRARPKVSQ